MERTTPQDAATGECPKCPEDLFESWNFGELLSEFLTQSRRLARAEVRLARAELRSEARKVSAGARLLAGGGAVLLLGAMALVAFLVALLAELLPLWASALIVGAALLAVGATIVLVGLRRMRRVHGPRRTIQTLKDDGQWASRTAHAMKSETHGHA